MKTKTTIEPPTHYEVYARIVQDAKTDAILSSLKDTWLPVYASDSGLKQEHLEYGKYDILLNDLRHIAILVSELVKRGVI